MVGFLRTAGKILVLALLVAHLFLMSLFIAPAPKLLHLALGGSAGFIDAADIPKPVETFIFKNKIKVENSHQMTNGLFDRLILEILNIRREHFMDDNEQLALDLNLLDYGKGVIGIKSAAFFYYKQPISELSDQQWLTLINLQKIFSKK